MVLDLLPKSEARIPRRTRSGVTWRKNDFRDSVRINAIFRRKKLYQPQSTEASPETATSTSTSTESTTESTTQAQTTAQTTTTTTNDAETNTKKSARRQRSRSRSRADPPDIITADAIRRANFDGKIPIRLALAQSSLSSATPPHPQHALVSRHTYLHIGLESAVRALHEYAPLALSGHRKIVVREGGDGGDDGGDDEDENGKEADNGNGNNNNNNENNNKNVNDTVNGNGNGTESPGPLSDETVAEPAEQNDSDAGEGTPPMTTTTTPPYPVCWFEDVATQQPLRWQYFAGVLFDSLHAPSNHRHRQKIPWELRLHFRSYPSDTILELIDPNHGHGEGVLETIKRTYKNSLKQGLVIHHGNAREAVNMSKQSHTVLWEEGIRKNNYEAIRPILFPESSDGAGNQATRAVTHEQTQAQTQTQAHTASNSGKSSSSSSSSNNDNDNDTGATATATATATENENENEKPNTEKEKTKDAKDDNSDNHGSGSGTGKDQKADPAKGTEAETKPIVGSSSSSSKSHHHHQQQQQQSVKTAPAVTKKNPSLAMIPVRLSLDPTKPMLQKRIEGGSSADSMTLGSLLREWTPQRLFQTDESAQSVADRFIWTVSGISPPLCTPLIDLWKTLRHADNFLYISVTPRNDNVHNSNSNSNSNNNKTSRAKLRSKTTIVAAKLSSAQQRRRRNT